jgi:hypothetical protein
MKCGFIRSAAPLCAKTSGAGRNTQKPIRKLGSFGGFRLLEPIFDLSVECSVPPELRQACNSSIPEKVPV